MPELPEVETTRRGIDPHITGRTIQAAVVRDPRLRWPVPADLADRLAGQIVRSVDRRGKYLLVRTDDGTVILHLGMSGTLRVVPAGTAAQKHDHVDFILDSGKALRLNDPRRFGAVLWTSDDPKRHWLLANLGVEPLSQEFTPANLRERLRGRRAAIKTCLMDSRIVAGIGNIYASESLFIAGINPKRAGGRLSLPRTAKLVEAIKTVLSDAIRAGGTTLRDYTLVDGQPGYFQYHLNVYGHDGEPCPNCDKPIRCVVIGQRATYYCTTCQT